MLSWRLLALRAATLVATILSLATVALVSAAPFAPFAPVAQASGPGPCAEITSADQAHASLTAAGGVSARLSRTQGTVGTALTVMGAGWPAGASVLVDVYLKRNGQVYSEETLSQATAAADGTLLTAQFRAPRSETCSSLNMTPDGRAKDGGAILLLIHTRDGKARTPLTFTYLTYDNGPQVTAAPANSALTPGTALTLTGAHWEPGERVTIIPQVAPWVYVSAGPVWPPAFQPVPGLVLSATADAQGAFSAVVPALDEPPGTQFTAIAEGTGPRYGDVNVDSYYYQMLPKIYPSIHLDQSGVYAGGKVTVTGERWPANVAGVVEYCRGQMGLPDMVGLRCLGGQHLGDFQTDGAGRFSATVSLPANAALGPITVQARVPTAPFGLIVYAQSQPLRIIPTFTQAHPRLTRVMGMAPYLAGGAVALLTPLVVTTILIRRRRKTAPATE